MSKGPVHEIRLSLIKASIFENRANGTLRHSVSFTRLYKNGERWVNFLDIRP